MAATKKNTANAQTRSANPKTLKDLRQDPKNARKHTERNLAMINDSLELAGAGRSLVIDEGATILTEQQMLEHADKIIADAEARRQRINQD